MDKNLDIISVPINFHQDGVSIKLPMEYSKYLGISKRGKYNKELFVIPINGLIQISAGQPFTVIPAMTEKDEFERQLD